MERQRFRGSVRGASRPPGQLALPGRFRAVVFDVDGLLVATEPAWAAAEAELLARHGGVHLPEDHLEPVGRSVDATIAVYARRMGIEAARMGDLREELVELVLARLPAAVPMPGAVDLVRSLAGRLPLGVASSSLGRPIRARQAGTAPDDASSRGSRRSTRSSTSASSTMLTTSEAKKPSAGTGWDPPSAGPSWPARNADVKDR